MVLVICINPAVLPDPGDEWLATQDRSSAQMESIKPGVSIVGEKYQAVSTKLTRSEYRVARSKVKYSALYYQFRSQARTRASWAPKF